MPKRSAVSTWHISYIHSDCICKAPFRALFHEWSHSLEKKVAAKFQLRCKLQPLTSSVCVDFVLISPEVIASRASELSLCVWHDDSCPCVCVFPPCVGIALLLSRMIATQDGDALPSRAESWRHIDCFPKRKKKERMFPSLFAIKRFRFGIDTYVGCLFVVCAFTVFWHIVIVFPRIQLCIQITPHKHGRVLIRLLVRMHVCVIPECLGVGTVRLGQSRVMQWRSAALVAGGSCWILLRLHTDGGVAVHHGERERERVLKILAGTLSLPGFLSCLLLMNGCVVGGGRRSPAPPPPGLYSEWVFHRATGCYTVIKVVAVGLGSLESAQHRHV